MNGNYSLIMGSGIPFPSQGRIYGLFLRRSFGTFHPQSPGGERGSVYTFPRRRLRTREHLLENLEHVSVATLHSAAERGIITPSQLEAWCAGRTRSCSKRIHQRPARRHKSTQIPTDYHRAYTHDGEQRPGVATLNFALHLVQLNKELLQPAADLALERVVYIRIVGFCEFHGAAPSRVKPKRILRLRAT
jgi:hypothetical protein